MQFTYPAIYRDRFGEEATAICNDGTTLHMQVRGVTFVGQDFDGFEPLPETDSDLLSTFTIDEDSLCDCEILCDMPLPVISGDQVIMGTLKVHLTLGQPRPKPRGGIDREDLVLQLSIQDMVIRSRGISGSFEDELLDIEHALPNNAHIKACITCAFSDYSPIGQGLFGGMACFRDYKAEYRTVDGKQSLFKLLSKLKGSVQETFLCDEFEMRIPGSGYRG